MLQGRGRSAAGCRVRMRGRRRRAACTAGARSSGPARAAARRCSSCRRCRRRATRRRTRWSRRRRRCDGRGRPLPPPRPRTRGLPPALPPGSLPAPVWTSPGRPATQSPRAGGEPDSGVESAPTDQTLRDLHLGIAWRHPQEVTAAAPPPASGRSARVPRLGTASWALLPTWPGLELSWHSRVTVPIVTADSGT